MREPESGPGGQIDRPPPQPPPTPRTHPPDTPPWRASGTTSSTTDDSVLPVGATSGIALRVTKRKDVRRSYHHILIHQKTSRPTEGSLRRPTFTRDNDTEDTAKVHRKGTPTTPKSSETRLLHKKRNRNRTHEEISLNSWFCPRDSSTVQI